MENHEMELWQVLIGASLRYIIFAGSAYLLFYVLKRNQWLRFKIQPKFPNHRGITTEIKYSILTALIFGVVIYFTLFSSWSGYTRIYSNLHDYSAWYFWASILISIVIHDTYFYWMHRFIHLPRVFRYVHHIHHRSHNPTPLAAYSFHPIEAILEIAVLPLIALLIPIHKAALGLFGLYMILLNVHGHLGYELLPKRFRHSRWFKWLNTSTHHNMHHHYSKANFGLYFNFWDRLMGTNHPDYSNEFEKAARGNKTKDVVG
jgi:sterol desaturase/sphingolipid hydroxylase (fatty acid hydroxylase superfamily)